MKCQSSNERSNSTNVLRHSHGKSDYHRVKNNPNFKHLRNQPLFQFYQFFTSFTITAGPMAASAELQLLLLRHYRRVLRVLHVRARREVHQERQKSAHKRHESCERKVLPRVVRRHLAIGECGVRVGEHVDQRGRENHPRRKTLDHDYGLVVERLPAEDPG
ncbi:hypothetical protein V8G54_037554 [Vigna mungo]|uniref:Uncharacterized protein n=1 Tax=Vigna mungo TaxID=3915 RepID=A0AAQ3MJK5_VIGMU